MALGIRPIIDFAFKKVFGSADDLTALIHLLNAILKLKSPLVAVVVQNPYNAKDFEDDKLSILDIKATDAAGAVYHVEMQLTIPLGLTQRIVFYGCELVADQLQAGDDYTRLQPVFSICLLNGILWPEATKVHHTFRLTDQESGRVLDASLEIHTIELGHYNLQEKDLATAGELDCWLYWLLHAHEYEAERLRELFSRPGLREATDTLIRIAEITEDKMRYDAREKAIRDRQWQLNSAYLQGQAKGEATGRAAGDIKLIRTLQELLRLPVGDEAVLGAMPLEQLTKLADSLREQLRAREPK